MPQKPGPEWVQRQLIDSLFPTGGFAHSYGLEAAIQQRIVRNKDPKSLYEFAITTLYQCGNFSLPIFYAVTQCMVQHKETHQKLVISRLVQLHIRVDAMHVNHVAKRASYSQGAALFRIASNARGIIDDVNLLVQFRAALKDRNERCEWLDLESCGLHHVVVMAVLTVLLDIDAETGQRMYLFVLLRDILSAATRLNIVGPMESTRMHLQTHSATEEIFQSHKNCMLEEAYTSAPILDLVQGKHEQLYTRIFNS